MSALRSSTEADESRMLLALNYTTDRRDRFLNRLSRIDDQVCHLLYPPDVRLYGVLQPFDPAVPHDEPRLGREGVEPHEHDTNWRRWKAAPDLIDRLDVPDTVDDEDAVVDRLDVREQEVNERRPSVRNQLQADLLERCAILVTAVLSSSAPDNIAERANCRACEAPDE